MNLKNLIFIGGVGRSGTSILSSILASTKDSEYFYEPAVLMHLIEKLNLYSKHEDVGNLFQTIIEKDLVKGAISGRNLNLNKEDLSSVYRYKTEEVVNERLRNSTRQYEVSDLIRKTNAVIKILDNIRNFDLIQRISPDSQAVIIIRNPINTLNSIINKDWFSNESMSLNSPEPSSSWTAYKGYRVNSFIPKNKYDEWINYSEEDRCAYYYQLHLNQFNRFAKDKSVHFVDYDDFVNRPNIIVKNLCKKFRLEYDVKTSEIVNEVKPTEASINQRDYIKPPSKSLILQMDSAYQTLRKKTIGLNGN